MFLEWRRRWQLEARNMLLNWVLISQSSSETACLAKVPSNVGCVPARLLKVGKYGGHVAAVDVNLVHEQACKECLHAICMRMQ